MNDGRRLHMQDGPIDVIVEAFGEVREIEVAYRAAAARFVGVLDELCGELKFLRRSAREGGDLPSGAIARRMVAAVRPYASQTFITPMAAVAGAVAEEILEAMTDAAELARAYVNDGGDIALHLTAGEKFVAGMVELPDRPTNPTFRKPRNVGHPLFGTTLARRQFILHSRFAASLRAAGAGVVFRWALRMRSQYWPIRLRWPTLQRR
jgi:ApbE superfamily uncharacterized protein (UPF0280 family)